MDTKRKILNAALEVYNNKGVNATTRHIAEHIAISVGNLHYHFKHTDDIIIALYEQIAADFDVVIRGLDKHDLLNHYVFDQMLSSSFNIVYRYRFFFLNFVEIGRRIPMIKKYYQELMGRRQKELKVTFRKFVAEGHFRGDLSEQAYDSLVTQCFILNDFWLSHNELVDRLNEQEAEKRYMDLMKNVLNPYMTKI